MYNDPQINKYGGNSGGNRDIPPNSYQPQIPQIHHHSISGSFSEDTTLYENYQPPNDSPFISQSLKIPLKNDDIYDLLSGDLISNPEKLCKLKKLAEEQPTQWSSRSLIDSLERLCDTRSYTYTDDDTATTLELHLRTFAAVLETLIQNPIILNSKLREKLYKQLTEFNNIHHNISVVMERGLNKRLKGTLRDLNVSDVELEIGGVKRNYNIDFLLIHLRDTLHSLRDDETRFREGWRRTKEFFKGALGMAPAAIPALPADNSNILTSWNKMREAFGFKVPVSSWYKDWRLLLMLKQTMDASYQEGGNHALRKFGERMLLEYLWALVKQIISRIDSKDNNDLEFSKVFNNKQRLFAELAEIEPLSYNHSLWFGILDLAGIVCATSTRSITLSLCYYLALDSLNNAPSTFIRFKSIEILLSLQHRRRDWFEVVVVDLEECAKKFKNKSKFFSLVSDVKYKLALKEKMMNSCGFKTFNHLDDDFPAITTKSANKSILSLLAQEMLCPVSMQISDQYYALTCGHAISKGAFNAYKYYQSRRGKDLTCSICRTVVNEESLTLLPQNSTLNALYDRFIEAGLLSHGNNSEYEMISNPESLTSEDLKDIKKPSNNMLNIITRHLTSIDNPPDPLVLVKNSFKQNPQNPQKALLILDKIIQTNKDKAPLALLERAKIYNVLQRFGEALHDVNNSLQVGGDDNNDVEKYKLRAHLRFQLKMYHDSLNDVDIVINRIESYKTVNEDYKYTPSDLAAYELRGNIYIKIESFYHEAILDFTVVLENTIILENVDDDNLNTTLLDSLVNRGSLFREIRRYKESLEDLTKAIQLNPNHMFAIYLRGSVYCKLNKFSEALDDLNKVLNSTMANDEVKVKLLARAERGDLFCKQSRFNEGLSDLDFVLQQDPHNILARSRKGYILFTLKKYHSAQEELDLAIDLEPNNYYSLTYRGMVHLNLKNYKASLADFNAVLGRFPNNSVTIRQRAVVYFIMGKYEESLIDFDKLINLDENDMDALCYRVEILNELGRYGLCIDDCNTILKFDSSNCTALRIKGMALRKLGQNGKALSELDKVISQQPDNAIALLERSAVYATLHRYPDSLSDCEKILYLNPDENIPYFQEMTKVYGELSEAIGVSEILIHLERVLQDSPNNSLALTTRAYIYLLQWECDKAINDLSVTLRYKPNFVLGLFQRSVIYRITQDYVSALKDLEKILELEPGNGFAQTEKNEIQSMKDFDRNQSHAPNYNNQPPANRASRRSSKSSNSSRSSKTSDMSRITNNMNNTRYS